MTRPRAYPDTLVGTDSHTTMVNGLGVLGWGVGGIEAEAAMLGQPISMLIPQVIGFRLTGKLPEGATATDLVLTVTQALRKKGVVGKFVEFYGPGSREPPAGRPGDDREHGPRVRRDLRHLPVDAETLRYLRLTGRTHEQIELAEAYARRAGPLVGRRPSRPSTHGCRSSTSAPSSRRSPAQASAGPRAATDRASVFRGSWAWCSDRAAAHGPRQKVRRRGHAGSAATSPAIAAARARIVRCSQITSTQRGWNGKRTNPRAVAPMRHGHADAHRDGQVDPRQGRHRRDHELHEHLEPVCDDGRRLLAQKAQAHGLRTQPWVKTSLAPGSKVVTEYFDNREPDAKTSMQLGFNLVGYGCTTCIGNSGPAADRSRGGRCAKTGLVVAAVLSGNRNFEGRIHPRCARTTSPRRRSSSPTRSPGTIDIDFDTEPLGTGNDGKPVFLNDIWPTAQKSRETMADDPRPRCSARVRHRLHGRRALEVARRPAGRDVRLGPDSTYMKNPPYFDGMPAQPTPVNDITGARVLALLGDTVTTDHISPAGSIKPDGPAGKYLIELGVKPADFNSYGSRRGNHEVMVRGTFANVRLKNKLAPGTEGGVRDRPLDEQDVDLRRRDGVQARSTPLVVLAGKEYGTGSSRDWAAKGTAAAGREGRHRRELRAHPPLEPRRHGRAAAAVPARRERRFAGPHRPRGLRDHHRCV